jgi:hypothetical protein
MPEVRHAMAPEEIMAFLDGELPSERAAETLSHLERCAECQKLAADLQRVSRELKAWEATPPRDLTAPAGEAERPFGIRPRATVFATVAFAVCAAVAVVAFVKSHSERETARVTQFTVDGRLSPDLSRFTRAPAPAPPLNQQAKQLDALEPPPQPAPTSPMIERTASLDIATRDFDRLRTRIDAILAVRHGYIGELTLNAPPQAGRSLNATLRVPAADFDAALADLRQLGRVQSESQKGEDVTRQYADSTARLSNARNTEQRLTEILKQRTGKLSDVLEVERELARVRVQIEQMDAERRVTADQVAFAVVQLTASEEFHAQLQLSPDSTVTRLRNAAVDGYKNLAGTLVGMATACIRYGPTVLLWLAIAFFGVRWALRLGTRGES